MGNSSYHAGGDTVDYTPSSAVTAGDIVVLNSAIVGLSTRDIAASRKGALTVRGIVKMPKADADGAISQGEKIYWDADGDPASGTAGTGAATTTEGDNVYAGWCAEDSGSSNNYVMVYLESTARPDQAS
jgi:predicted RecA/RadA family phage recombinase